MVSLTFKQVSNSVLLGVTRLAIEASLPSSQYSPELMVRQIERVDSFMSRANRLALMFSLLAVAAAYLVAERVFERMPHIEDEIAYVWQAQAIAGGRLTVPTPAHPQSFLVPFVVDYNGQRFGKYPLGWPARPGAAYPVWRARSCPAAHP